MGVVSSDSHAPACERTWGLDGGKADSVAEKFSSEGSAFRSTVTCVEGASPLSPRSRAYRSRAGDADAIARKTDTPQGSRKGQRYDRREKNLRPGAPCPFADCAGPARGV